MGFDASSQQKHEKKRCLGRVFSDNNLQLLKKLLHLVVGLHVTRRGQGDQLLLQIRNRSGRSGAYADALRTRKLAWARLSSISRQSRPLHCWKGVREHV